MKAKILLFLMFLAFPNSIFKTAAQAVVESATIESVNINLRENPVVLNEVKVTVSEPGIVVVDFDGKCVSSPGDQLRLAASNIADWGVNDGGVTIEAFSDDINRHSFSHTRAYPVTAGDYTFYAVGENFGKTEGDGIGSIYGTLVARFFPDNGKIKAYHQGIIETNEDVRGDPVSLASQTINVPGPGEVLVRFNGYCVGSPGDLIILAASDHLGWTVNDGNTAIEAINTSITRRVFNHTRLYNVNAGEHTFHAVVQNYVETAGTGIASVYGSLTIIYFPDNLNSMVALQGISRTRIDVRGSVVTLGTISLNPTVSGKAIVTFDGLCSSNPGDRIVLAASDQPTWSPNAGNVNVESITTDLDYNNFSHTRTYDISAGAHTFYAVAQNYVEEEGSGIASFYASLAVQFFPDISTGIINTFSDSSANVLLWPNPASEVLQVSLKNFPSGKTLLEVYNLEGKLLKRTESISKDQFTIDTSAYPAGNYLLRVTRGPQIMTRQFTVL
jgi:hypothetical protein